MQFPHQCPHQGTAAVQALLWSHEIDPELTGKCIRYLSGLCDLNPSVYNETWSSKPLSLRGHQNTTPLFILPVPSEPHLTDGEMHRSWEHLLVKQRHPKQTMTLSSPDKHSATCSGHSQ